VRSPVTFLHQKLFRDLGLYGVNEIMERLYSMDNYWYLGFARLVNIMFLLQVLLGYKQEESEQPDKLLQW
jgi:hypothetical protein